MLQNCSDMLLMLRLILAEYKDTIQINNYEFV